MNKRGKKPDKTEKTKVLRIFLVRHGRTALEGRYKGQLDLPLSPEGIKDMEGSALILKKILGGGGFSLEAVYASDLMRAVQSAEMIAGAFGIKEVVRMELLRERAFGEWEGMRYDEIERVFPREFAQWVKDPFSNSPVGGESSQSVKRRALASMREIIDRNRPGSRPGGAIAIVSHSGILRVLLCHFLGMPYKNIFRADIGFGGISLVELFDFNFETPVVRFMNLMPALAQSIPSPSASLLPLPRRQGGPQ